MAFPWHLYVMAVIYILAGLNHFRAPKMYERIIPPILTSPKIINVISGLVEVLLGVLLLVPKFSAWAAWGIIILLIAVFPANLYMVTNKKASFGLPKWLLIARLPLQLLLMYWAYLYT